MDPLEEANEANRSVYPGYSYKVTSTDLSWERRGLDMLLIKYSEADLTHAIQNEAWLSVNLMLDQSLLRFSIWRHTGCVYEIDDFGAAADDPLLIPEGSPYLERTHEATKG